MQKKVLAAALGGLLISPAAFADVSVYGLVDVGFQLADPGGSYDGSETFLGDTMGTGGSRLGFRANEDLGGGLRALAVMELGWSIDTGQLDNAPGVEIDPGPPVDASLSPSKIFQRQTFAGLAGDWGQVTAGRQYREVFLTGTRGSYNYTGSGTGVFFLHSDTGVRQDNMIKYTSPEIGPGLNLIAAYAPGEGTDPTGADDSNGEYTEFALRWGSGPLTLAAAFGSSTAKSAGNEVDTDITIVGGNYKLGPTTIYALYSTVEPDGGAEISAISLGASHRVGNHVFVAAFGTVEDEVRGGSDDNESTLVGLRYENWLSKTTNLFLTYGTMDNDANVARAAPRSQAGATNNESSDAISAGFVIRF